MCAYIHRRKFNKYREAQTMNIKIPEYGVLLHLRIATTFIPGAMLMLRVVGSSHLCLGWCGKALCRCVPL